MNRFQKPRLLPPGADRPAANGTTPAENAAGNHPAKPLEGFRTLGQSAFGALAKINRDRKEKGKPE
jgi:hypothetical protein